MPHSLCPSSCLTAALTPATGRQPRTKQKLALGVHVTLRRVGKTPTLQGEAMILRRHEFPSQKQNKGFSKHMLFDLQKLLPTPGPSVHGGFRPHCLSSWPGPDSPSAGPLCHPGGLSQQCHFIEEGTGLPFSEHGTCAGVGGV